MPAVMLIRRDLSFVHLFPLLIISFFLFLCLKYFTVSEYRKAMILPAGLLTAMHRTLSIMQTLRAMPVGEIA